MIKKLGPLLFKLTRVAKSKGGDRYEYGTKGDESHMVFYIPQTISRREDKSKHFPGSAQEKIYILLSNNWD